MSMHCWFCAATNVRLRHSELSVDRDNSDLAQRIPWKAFFTNRYSLTLFANSWAFVSSILQ